MNEEKKLSKGENTNEIFSDPNAEKTKQLSFGEKLCGVGFNPSENPNVFEVKQLFARIADILNTDFHSRGQSGLAATLYEHSIGEILNAQMNVVKVLTFKH